MHISALLALAFGGALALAQSGINNKGSGNCKKGAMSDIINYISQIPDEQIYIDGEKIVCSGIHGGIGGGTCAFLQNTGGATGYEVKILANDLAAHPNTEGCGSIPMTFPAEFGGYNSLASAGMLTVNYVANTDNPCPPGVCGASACTGS